MWTSLEETLFCLPQSSINYESYAYGTIRLSEHGDFLLKFLGGMRAIFTWLSLLLQKTTSPFLGPRALGNRDIDLPPHVDACS